MKIKALAFAVCITSGAQATPLVQKQQLLNSYSPEVFALMQKQAREKIQAQIQEAAKSKEYHLHYCEIKHEGSHIELSTSAQPAKSKKECESWIANHSRSVYRSISTVLSCRRGKIPTMEACGSLLNGGI